MTRTHQFLLSLFTLFFSTLPIFAQNIFKKLPLPSEISSVKEEFSGMAWSQKRLYLLPQYGGYKETLMDGKFSIYSLHADSIARVIDGKDTSLTSYRILAVKNLNKLPDSVKKYYQGFEAITIVNNQVFLAIETADQYNYCFILKGTLDVQQNEIIIDPISFIALKRYPYIFNAGFESLTYLPAKKKLMAMFEFNGMANGGIGFLIDTTFKNQPKKIKVPFLPFRITDTQVNSRGRIYGLNYYWEGDYETYLNNILLRNQENGIKKLIPDFGGNLKTNSYARIVTKKRWNSKKWEHVVSFDGKYLNWEGLALFRNGALIITDANRSNKLYTTLAYITF
ncbi:hypothetical protein AAKU52_000175 [Pedobacter sp. CG_S7]|uniref:hypothetical protein n=1 Tax=Pedobacter sp. CG_S7 TaxID=3143930 RepID=UPI003393250B